MNKRTKIFPYIIILIYLCFNVYFVFSQESYNNCIQAIDLCPNQILTANNINANKTLCTDCEDDFSSKICFSSNNTVWFRFYTNELGGNITISFSEIKYVNKPSKSQNLQAAIIQSKVPCDASTFKQIDVCELNGTSSFTLNAFGLEPNETYYLVVNGALNTGDTYPAEANFNIQIQGSAINRPIPTLSIAELKPKYCQNEAIVFQCSITDCKDSTSYNWYLNNELIAVSDTNVVSFSKLKTGDQLKVSNTCFTSCPFIVKDSVTLPQIITFDVNAGKDTTIYEGATFKLNGSSTANKIYWSPTIFLDDSTTLNPTFIAKKTISYQLNRVIDDCKLSDIINIHVIQQENSPPNSFSPNGDKINDTWEIPFLQDFPNCHVQVYTRWGQTIFETTGYTYQKSWDGTFNGNQIDPGTYFYVIELRDKNINEPIKGSLTIIR
jgi:gliding motility-associated-like protein